MEELEKIKNLTDANLIKSQIENCNYVITRLEHELQNISYRIKRYQTQKSSTRQCKGIRHKKTEFNYYAELITMKKIEYSRAKAELKKAKQTLKALQEQLQKLQQV